MTSLRSFNYFANIDNMISRQKLVHKKDGQNHVIVKYLFKAQVVIVHVVMVLMLQSRKSGCSFDYSDIQILTVVKMAVQGFKHPLKAEKCSCTCVYGVDVAIEDALCGLVRSYGGQICNKLLPI